MKSLFEVNYYKPTETPTVMIKNTILTNIFLSKRSCLFYVSNDNIWGSPIGKYYLLTSQLKSELKRECPRRPGHADISGHVSLAHYHSLLIVWPQLPWDTPESLFALLSL